MYRNLNEKSAAKKTSKNRISKLEDEIEKLKASENSKFFMENDLSYLAFIGESQVLVPCGHIIPSNHSTNNYQRCPICKTNIDNSLKATLDSSIVPALK